MKESMSNTKNSIQADVNLLGKRNHVPPLLGGEYVRLEPFVVARDSERLFELFSNETGKLILLYDVNFKNISDFKTFLHKQIVSPNDYCFCIFDQFTDQQIGIISFIHNSQDPFKIELSSMWLSPNAPDNESEIEAIYLFLKHTFEQGYRRIDCQCDPLDERAYQVAIKTGFKFDCIQENQLPINGAYYDSTLFKIMKVEWFEIKENIEKSLYNKKSEELNQREKEHLEEMKVSVGKRIFTLAFSLAFVLCFFGFKEDLDVKVFENIFFYGILPVFIAIANLFIIDMIKNKSWENKLIAEKIDKWVNVFGYSAIYIYFILETFKNLSDLPDYLISINYHHFLFLEKYISENLIKDFLVIFATFIYVFVIFWISLKIITLVHKKIFQT